MLAPLSYTFDPVEFHESLEREVVADGQINYAQLREKAAKALGESSAIAREALAAMRFDPVWLRPSDDEADRETYWYIILLAQRLEPLPSLRYPGLAVRALESAGWNREDANALIMGGSLSAVLRSTGHAPFFEITKTIDTFASALSLPRIIESYPRLIGNERHFRRSATEVPGLAAEWGLHSSDPELASKMSETYDELLRMFAVALEREQPMVLIFD